MESIELLVVVLNLVIVLVAYFSVYPKVAEDSFYRIAFYDIFASGLAIVIVGAKYWGTGQEFSVVFGQVNWFWFTFITYALIELPVMLWYFRKNQVELKIRS